MESFYNVVFPIYFYGKIRYNKQVIYRELGEIFYVRKK